MVAFSSSLSSRLVFSLSLAAATVAALALDVSPAAAQSPKDRAEALNNEGKQLLKAKPMRAAEAAEKFREAIVLVPDGGYYYNLCMALYHEGKLGEAYTACKAVGPNGGNEAAVKQSSTIVEKHIRPQMLAAGIDPDAPPDNTGGGTGGDGGAGGDGTTGGDGTSGGTGGDGTGGDGTGGGGGSEGGAGSSGAGGAGSPQNFTVAPPPSLFTVTTPPGHSYTWTLGAQLLGMSTSMGQQDAYASGGAGFRFTGDYNLVPSQNLGAQAYVDVTSVGEGDVAETLNVFDLGIAGFKELCAGRACLKPLVGAHLGLFQTGSQENTDGQVSMAAFGLRAEIGAEYAIGTRYEHLITAGLGANVYTAVGGETDGMAEALRLDEASSMVYFGLGYTYRFNTPLGSSPFFQLQ